MMNDQERIGSEATDMAATLEQHANEILAVLAETMQLDELRFGDENECVVTIDNRFVLLFYLDTEDTHAIIINVPLGYLPQNRQREGLLYDMLVGNYCWGLTEGATLGVDDDEGQVCLSYLIDLPMAEQGQVIDIVSKLLSAAAYWQDRIAEAGRNSAPDPVAAEGSPMMRV